MNWQTGWFSAANPQPARTGPSRKPLSFASTAQRSILAWSGHP
jgi:hypothetical protein